MNEQNANQSLAQPEISVIVPVYKVERFLPACIDSLLAQTFADFELILVDDGSPDGCPVLCDAAAEKDNRVRVLHKANGGVSTARNAGLDMARGKWIAFVDSDDSVQPDYLERCTRQRWQRVRTLPFAAGSVWMKKAGSSARESRASQMK